MKKGSEMHNKLLFALSLCRKAGALVMGFDTVKDSVNQGNACLVLLASDLSPATRERVVRFCQNEIETADMPLTQSELSAVSKKPVGKPRGALPQKPRRLRGVR